MGCLFFTCVVGLDGFSLDDHVGVAFLPSLASRRDCPCDVAFFPLLSCGHVRGANVVRTRMNRVSFKRRCKDTMKKLPFANFFCNFFTFFHFFIKVLIIDYTAVLCLHISGWISKSSKGIYPCKKCKNSTVPPIFRGGITVGNVGALEIFFIQRCSFTNSYLAMLER